ncbi:MAG: EamA family transporter [Oscillospiraceae bacterium]|nr:EamA family transporter [Oscillospiraceae bacterium]
MYIAFLLLLSVTASQILSLSYKKGAERTVDPVSSPPLMCTFASVFIACVFAVAAYITDGGVAFPNRMSLVYALGVGVAYAFASFFYLVALATGPYTISAILLNLSSFMPILYSRIFLGEETTPAQLAGLSIVIVSCALLTVTRSRGKQDAKINGKWMVCAFLMFVSNSMISFFIRVNTTLAPETSSNSLFAAAYVFASVICFSFFLATNGIKKKISPKPLIFPAACVAGSLALQLTPTAILPKYLSAALQYPLEKGASILAGVAIGMFFFKEKIGKVGWICIAAIIGAMCLLGIK